MEIILLLLLIGLCCVVIWRASDGFEAASQYLGRHLSEGVRGASINAIGSSMPELLTTLFFLFVLKDKDGFAGGIAATAGSAIFNGMIIPAAVIGVVVLSGRAKWVQVSSKVILRDGIALLLCEFVLILLVGSHSLDWYHGLILVLLYMVYAFYMVRSMKRMPKEENQQEELPSVEENPAKTNVFLSLLTLDLHGALVTGKMNTRRAWVLLLCSVTVIGGACFFLVKACEGLGDALGISVYFVAIVLASAATSVPDTVLSVKDAQKGNYDDAVSNALGSNIFDVCFALGFPLLVFTAIFGPIHMSEQTIQNVSELRVLLLIFTFFTFLVYLFNKKMGIGTALLLFLGYVFFTAFILGETLGADFSNVISDYLLRINNGIGRFRIG